MANPLKTSKKIQLERYTMKIVRIVFTSTIAGDIIAISKKAYARR